MADLFASQEANNFERVQPLAARMRPRSLKEYAGQQHLIGEGQLLWRLLKAQQLGSVILYGPPGTGKTTLARLLAQHLAYEFRQLSAVTSGVKDIREQLESARDRVATGRKQTLLFIDEIHRFNRAQQDALLPDVEDGVVILVGATTSNPFFAVNSALVSRSRVFELEPLAPADIRGLLDSALADKVRGMGKFQVVADDEALDYLSQVCDGDARQALSTLEIAVLSSDKESDGQIHLTKPVIASAVQRRAVAYDGSGDEHYDCASALIKSIRGSDPDASVYWLARMLEGGEDPRFLCRRLVILASEDIGNADPHALTLAVSAMQATEFVGLPECQLTLSQAVLYLALAPKSNAATMAIGSARSDIRDGRIVPVPRHLRDGHYAGSKQLGHGQGYQYSHEAEDGVAAQDYLGVDRQYYEPTTRGYEKVHTERLAWVRKRLRGE
ncbi:replication-associated recombination protein A [Aeoliella mucimassa]|uniref:Replication-associated recombination protein A n=1 Tax=Aeoliella mucimassa TaxID=2527972 RepID=A0A518AL89_9BACT|nr:replication-associated recombination protein A [Aeoliella mucimassa]QDU55487.1 Replication-associated recombination protein A [Aeoliella mucimassa]